MAMDWWVDGWMDRFCASHGSRHDTWIWATPWIVHVTTWTSKWYTVKCFKRLVSCKWEMGDVTFFIASYVVNIRFGSWRNFQKSKMWSHTEPYGTEKKKHRGLQQRMRLKQMSSKMRRARPYQSQPVRPRRSPHLSRRIQRRGGGDGSRTPRRPSHPEPRRWSVKHIIATADILRTCPQQRQNPQEPSDSSHFCSYRYEGHLCLPEHHWGGLGSNLGQNTDRLFWRRISQSLRANLGIVTPVMPWMLPYKFSATYCHVSVAAWLIITGFYNLS
jgi:hypothetical protein